MRPLTVLYSSNHRLMMTLASVNELNRQQHGRPACIRSDNGPDLGADQYPATHRNRERMSHAPL